MTGFKKSGTFRLVIVALWVFFAKLQCTVSFSVLYKVLDLSGSAALGLEAQTTQKFSF